MVSRLVLWVVVVVVVVWCGSGVVAVGISIRYFAL
jgi:hypothetical protein